MSVSFVWVVRASFKGGSWVHTACPEYLMGQG